MNYPMAPRVTTRASMQVRFFRDRDLRALERALNDWLGERADREIAHVRQAVVPDTAGSGQAGEVVISVWYIEG